MIRLLDLPLVPEIEARLTINELTGVKATDHELVAMLETLVRQTLGVAHDMSDYWSVFYPDHVEVEADEDEDEDDIASWARDGFDVRAEDGTPLRCLDQIDWALEVVIAGESTRNRMEIEANLWQKGKATERAANQNHAAQNRKFLDLGARKRRGA